MKAEYDPNKQRITLKREWSAEEVYKWTIVHVAGPYLLAHIPWKRNDCARYAVIRLRRVKNKVTTLYIGEAVIMFMVDAEGGRSDQRVRLGVLVDELFVAQSHPRRWAIGDRSSVGKKAKKKK